MVSEVVAVCVSSVRIRLVINISVLLSEGHFLAAMDSNRDSRSLELLIQLHMHRALDDGSRYERGVPILEFDINVPVLGR